MAHALQRTAPSHAPRLGGVYVDANHSAPGVHALPSGAAHRHADPSGAAITSARTAGAFAVGTSVAIFIAAGAFFLAHTSPGQNLWLSVLFTPMHAVLQFVAAGTAFATMMSTVAALVQLRRRALGWEPPLARSQAEISRAHFVPGLNFTGPIAILAETGVRGRFSYAWFATLLLFPVTVVLFFWAKTVSETNTSAVVGITTFICWATAMFGIADGLAEVTSSRRVKPLIVPAPDPAFWERGIDHRTSRKGATVLTPPLTDEIDRFYII